MALSNPRFSSNETLAAAGDKGPPLKRGAEGEAVAIVQQALLDLGIAMPISTRAQSGLPDGIFGAETEAAVRAFQRANNLAVDGIAGRLTLGQLEESIRLLSAVDEQRFRSEYLRESLLGGMVS